MAHHKRRRASARAENKRIDHKRARAAGRQAISGGHHRAVAGMSWGTKLPQPALLDDTTHVRRKKRRGRWCRGHHGVEHMPAPGRKYIFGGYYSVVVCERCGKYLWDYRPPEVVRDEHYTTENIQLRLAGWPCQCERCRAEAERPEDHWNQGNIRLRLAGLLCACSGCHRTHVPDRRS